MSVYLDASVLVSHFVSDTLSVRADRFLRADGRGILIVSDFAAAEFSAVVTRKVRTGELGPDDADGVFADFDAWSARVAEKAETTTRDIAAAVSFLRRMDLGLRAPDAINIALAFRLGAILATFDERMARSALAVGLETADI